MRRRWHLHRYQYLRISQNISEYLRISRTCTGLDADTLLALEDLPCNIDRWQACAGRRSKKKKKGAATNCLSSEIFSQKYLHRRPVIVSGLGKEWEATKRWTSQDAFIARHGEVYVGVKDAGDLVLGGPGVVSATVPGMHPTM
eukprot:SAG31_NODE_1930_length_6881_cov_6.976998_12_plen_143_part_00